MELFRLLGTIAINNTDANRAISDTTGRAENSESVISKAFGKIGGAAVAVGKVMATGIAAGSAAIAALGKSALDAYADYEQLVGGVETLFGAGGKSIEEYAESVGKTVADASKEYQKLMNAQDTVMKNAEEAYKTAGMSMNEYMETVTSFSASLIQSLGGDTEAAATKAHQAITDMSDNANKMGSDMAMIQNAYNGFAKQNYTMLDNLKLGYGGTKTEMERLIKDASKMKDVQEELGITVDASSMSFGNIVDAISVVQKKMGIMGTTAKEAEKTISGSIASMKSAWQNLVTGFGNDKADLSGLVNQFVDSIEIVAGNVIPRIEIILNGIADAIVKIVPKISEKLPQMLNTLLPAIIDGAVALVDGLVQAMPVIVDGLMASIPALAEGITQIMVSLAMALPQCIIPIIGKLPEIAGTIMTAFSEAMSQSGIGDAWNWLQNMGDYVSEKLNPIVTDLQTAFTIVKDAVQPLIDKISEYVTSGNLADDVTTALKAGIDLLATAYETAKQKIQDIVAWLKENKSAVQATTNVVFVLISAFAGLKAGLVIQSIVQAFQQAQVAIAMYTATTNGASIAQGVLNGTLTIGEGLVALLTGKMTLAQVASALWATTTGAVTTAQTALNAALTANPIGLVVAAIAALIAIGVLLYKNWDTIKQKASELFTNVTAKFEAIKESVKAKNDALKESISKKWEEIKKGISDKANGIKKSVSDKFAAVKETMGTIMGAATDTVKEKLNNMENAYEENGGGIKGIASATIEGIKGYYTSGYTFINNLTNGQLGKVVELFKTKLGNAKNTVLDVFEKIKSTISEKINAAKESVGEAIEKIKGFFKFEWSLPKLKLPHFKIDGSFSLNPPSVPELGVEWYAKGGIMNNPTMFGFNPFTGKAMIGGEAGAEAIAPIDVLQGYVAEAVAGQNAELLAVLSNILKAIETMDDGLLDKLITALVEGVKFKVDNREIGRMVRSYVG